MADTKISGLTEDATGAIGDFLESLDISDTSMDAAGTNKKLKFETLAKLLADWRVVDRESSPNDIVNVATEQTLYSVTVPGNLLATERGVRLTLIGDYLNSSGSTKTLQVKVKYGATTLFDDVTGTIATNAARRELRIQIDLFNQGATNDQIMGGLLALSAVTAATTGRGAIDSTAFSNATGGTTWWPIGGDSAEDSTADKTLVVTAQHSVAHASTSIRRMMATLELI